MRKRVWLPLVVLGVGALGIGGFEGYGAYTRSKPVEYSRGGGDFAALPTASPTPGTTAAASASAAPSATPAATALPRVQATQRPEPATRVGPVATSAALVVPAVGTYPLAVQGNEKVQFGPVSFCSQTLPSSTDLVVKRAAGESATSYDFDVPFFPSSAGRHDERHIYRYSPSAVLLDYEIATVTCQGVRQSSDTSFTPEQKRVEIPLTVGASWHNHGGGPNRTEDATTTVLRTEVLAIQGRRVLTYVIETTTSFTGDESGTRDQTWWYARSWAMPVKWHEKQSGHRSGASYSGDITATVLAHP